MAAVMGSCMLPLPLLLLLLLLLQALAHLLTRVMLHTDLQFLQHPVLLVQGLLLLLLLLQ